MTPQAPAPGPLTDPAGAVAIVANAATAQQSCCAGAAEALPIPSEDSSHRPCPQRCGTDEALTPRPPHGPGWHCGYGGHCSHCTDLRSRCAWADAVMSHACSPLWPAGKGAILPRPRRRSSIRVLLARWLSVAIMVIAAVLPAALRVQLRSRGVPQRCQRWAVAGERLPAEAGRSGRSC